MRVRSLIVVGALALACQAQPSAAQGAMGAATGTVDKEIAAPDHAAGEGGRVGSLSPGEAKRAARARQRAAAKAGPAHAAVASPPAPRHVVASSPPPNHVAASPPAPRHIAVSPPPPSHVAASPPRSHVAERPLPKAVPIRKAERPREPARVHMAQRFRPAERTAQVDQSGMTTRTAAAPNAAARQRFRPVWVRPAWRYAGYPMRYVLSDGTVVYPRRRFWRFYAGYPRPYPRVRYVLPYDAPLYAMPPQRFGPPVSDPAGGDVYNQGVVDGQ